MSIAEKLTTVAENVPKVYEAGKLALLKDSEYANATENGTFISVNDVAPIEHSLGVKVESKNLCPNDWEVGTLDVNFGYNKSDSNVVRTKDYFTLDKSKKHYISADGLDSGVTITWFMYDKDKNFIKRFVSYQNRSISVSGATISIPEDTVFYRLVVATNDVNIKVQVELGSTATEYTPYVDVTGVEVTRYGEDETDNPQTATANADGTVEGLTSISPSMTLLSDNSNVIITCQYYRDIDGVFEAGQQAEREQFWHNMWHNSDGTMKTYFRNAFGGVWNEENFKPIYPNEKIKPVGSNGCRNMFYYFNRNASSDSIPIDMTEFCKHIDFSECTTATSVFENARVKNVTVDFGKCTSLTLAFGNGDKGYIDNLHIRVTEKCTNFGLAFDSASNLTTIIFTEDSVIASNISFAQSPLTVESMKSIINSLYDYSGTGTTHTLIFKANRENMLTKEEKAVATNKGWTLVWN